MPTARHLQLAEEAAELAVRAAADAASGSGGAASPAASGSGSASVPQVTRASALRPRAANGGSGSGQQKSYGMCLDSEDAIAEIEFACSMFAQTWASEQSAKAGTSKTEGAAETRSACQLARPECPLHRCTCKHGGLRFVHRRTLNSLHRRLAAGRYIFLCDECDRGAIIDGVLISLCRCDCEGCRLMDIVPQRIDWLELRREPDSLESVESIEKLTKEQMQNRCMRCGAPGATGKLIMLCAVCEGELAAADEATDAAEMTQLLDGYWALLEKLTKEQQIDGEHQALQPATR